MSRFTFDVGRIETGIRVMQFQGQDLYQIFEGPPIGVYWMLTGEATPNQRAQLREAIRIVYRHTRQSR